MAGLQTYFEKFHEAIRIDYDTSAELCEKRDIVLSRIRSHLKDNGRPAFTQLLQGSYAMKTGVKPMSGVDLEYDIDIGLRFGINSQEHDAATARSWVVEAVKGHTKSVEEKRPCIRVNYQKGYHLDLVVYAYQQEDSGEELFKLAHKTEGWRAADPPALLNYFNEAREPFDGLTDAQTKTDQFRRIVRYLKRWDDVAIPRESESKPSGLAYVLLCAHLLSPRQDVDGRPDDRYALEQLANRAGKNAGRIVEAKPTPEHEDLFGRLSDQDMDSLKSRFRRLAECLREADAQPDPVEACKALRYVFGSDFPVPDPEETAQKTKSPAIVTSSSQA